MLRFFEGSRNLGNYSLPDVLERIYVNQLALEAAVMELTLWVEQRGSHDGGRNVRGALETAGENAGHIRQMSDPAEEHGYWLADYVPKVVSGSYFQLQQAYRPSRSARKTGQARQISTLAAQARKSL